jgi:NitT/TauT family transport system permease protein
MKQTISVGRRALYFIKESWLTVAAFIFFFLFWELLVQAFGIPLYILPAPSRVGKDLIENIPVLIEHTLFTSWEVFFGFLFALALAIPLAMATAFSNFLKETFYPAAVTLEMIPKIAFAPLFIIWFGFGSVSKLFIVFLVCFFPIIINGIFGFTSLDNEYEMFIRSTGASDIKAFFKIRFPAALPSLFVGIKGAAVNATVGATIAEWVGGNMGLGFFIQKSTGFFRTSDALSAIIILTLLGLVLYFIVLAVERAAIPWHESQRKEKA